MVSIIERITNNEKVENLLEEKYDDILENIDVNITNLMYQKVTHFSFYHELGHLIQMQSLNLGAPLHPNEQQDINIPLI